MLTYCQVHPKGTNFSEILIQIQNFLFMKMRLKKCVKWWPFCPGVDELTVIIMLRPEQNFAENVAPLYLTELNLYAPVYLPYDLTT